MKFFVLLSLFVMFACSDRVSEQDPPQSGQFDAVIQRINSQMDQDAKPCDDFYQYACGRGSQVDETIFKQAQINHDFIMKDSIKSRHPVLYQFYTSCLNAPTIDPIGADKANIQNYLDLIQNPVPDTKSGLMGVIGKLNRLGTNIFFSNSVGTAPQEPKVYYLQIMDPIFNLLDTVDGNASIKPAIGRIMSAYGVATNGVLDIEEFAETTFSADQDQQWAAVNRGGLSPLIASMVEGLAPMWWSDSVEQGGAVIFLANKQYPNDMANYIENTATLEQLKNYVSAKFLAFVLANYPKNFDPGSPERQPFCIGQTNRYLWENIGYAFIQEKINFEVYKGVTAMVDTLKSQLTANTEKWNWLDAASQPKARAKSEAMVQNVAFMYRWPNLGIDGVDNSKDQFVNNVLRVTEHRFSELEKKIGETLSRYDFTSMPLTTWNAYYQDQLNSITILPGIMIEPTFVPNFSDAYAYGRLGAVVGHEIQHGFDSTGRTYDADGNLINPGSANAWSQTSIDNYNEKAQCVTDFYSGIELIAAKNGQPALKVNGESTLGENIADIAGLKLAYSSFLTASADGPEADSPVAGLSNKKLFFLGYAQLWCDNPTETDLRDQVKAGGHAPHKARVIGTLSQNEHFAAAFGCKAGDKYVPAPRCNMWP